MIEALKATQAEEVDKRDFCIAEFNENDRQTTDKSNQKDDLEQKLEDLAAVIEENTAAIASLNKDVLHAQIGMKQAGAVREAESKDFQQVIADQRATQAILHKALARLKEFYDKKASLLQRQRRQQQLRRQEPGAAVAAMPAAPAAHSPSGGSTGAMGLLE